MKKNKMKKRMVRLGKQLANKMSKTHMLKLKKLKKEASKISLEDILKKWKPKKIAYFKLLLDKERKSLGE